MRPSFRCTFALIVCLALFQGCFDSDSGGSANVAGAKNSTALETETVATENAKRDQPNANQDQPNAAEANGPNSAEAKQDENATKLDDATKIDPETKKKQGPPEKKYLEAQLHKNTTLLVLAYQPDIRADYLISNVRTVIDDQQYKAAKKLARQYDEQYKRILNGRAAILEVATDDTDVEGPLLELRKQVADLNATIRMRISREILTRDQRKEVVELNKLR